MKRKTILAIGALLLSATTLFSSNATAQASSAAASCAEFCLFQHDEHNFWGGEWVMFWPNGTCQNVDGPMNDSASSMINSTDRSVRLYNSRNCAGAVGYTAKPNSEDEDFSNNGFDNKASSLR
ncbi:peptidase inhibitor family I36 protein [Nonomuraea turcica]|uniref:peptidase inhibitor family I36 protein n=1 Tax=Nonomuraea sp. G32 TaxID=3067274 RepID=UPI00273C8286|nr:peptidase inhibitor family I36 protein [Nonomuraea sp. G32]MDP4511559.1 peptidase inhibitor family I36 protein [Nonomuraea sp. G32]